MEEDQILNYVYFDRYKPEKKIGQGSFGRIYRGEGVPKVYCFGNDNKHNILVMELLGRSVDSYFSECGKKFKLFTVCHLGIEMVKRIKFIHDKNHIHRDIKPENFVMGIDENVDKLYIIDFGLAKKYRSSKTHEHIPFKVHKKLTGTIRYSSTNASRRDDLESIGYLLCYFLRGNLPWQGLPVAKNEDRYKMIYKKKKNTSAQELTAGLHSNIMKYIEYCRTLKFEEEPKYDYLISLLSEAMEMNQLRVDFDFDWNKDRAYLTGNSKNDNSLLDNSMNMSNMKIKNSNSGYSSLINKNEISQDLKMIMIDNDNNSIKEYKEKEKLKEMESPKKNTYKTTGFKTNDFTEKKENENEIKKENLEEINMKPRSNSHIVKKAEDKTTNNNVAKQENLQNKSAENIKKKEEDNSICMII